MAQVVKHAGVVVKLAGQPYIIPALSMKQLKENKDTLSRLLEIDKATKGGTEVTADVMFEMVELAGKLVMLALSRNYEHVSSALVEECVDMSNAKELMEAVMGQSGFERVTTLPAEVGAQGEG